MMIWMILLGMERWRFGHDQDNKKIPNEKIGYVVVCADGFYARAGVGRG
jgi:hypothetical protein